MSLTKPQQDALNAPLPTSAIKSREGAGGRQLSYVDKFYVVDRMNEILGPASWGYEVSTKEEVRDQREHKPKTGAPYMRWNVTHTATCRLLVGGVAIQDVGAGHGQDRDLGQAIESSIKEAATDALKRCISSLGRSMGLALYQKNPEHVVNDGPDSLPAVLAEIPTKDALFSFLKENKGRIAEEFKPEVAGPWIREAATRLGGDADRAVAYVWGQP